MTAPVNRPPLSPSAAPPGWQLSRDQLLDYRHLAARLGASPKFNIRAARAGNYLARSKGRGMEFVEARHYQPGDDIRAIDWRVTARTGKTHTKIFQEEKERPVFVMVDYSPSMLFGSQLRFKAVQAAHLAALIGWQAVAAGDRLGALLFDHRDSHELRPRSRASAVLGLINQLVAGLPTRIQPASPGRLAAACQRLRRLLHPGSRVYVLSDFFHLDDECVKQLGLMKRHNDIIAVELFDPLERTLPADAGTSLAVTDGQSRKVLRLGSRQARARYQQQLEAHLAQRHQYLLQTGVRHWQVGAHLPLEEQLGGWR